MHLQIAALLDEAEHRYLKPDELEPLNQYMESLPTRMEAYCAIRDRELEIMQPVADQLQIAMPQEPIEILERSIKYALLVLRYCAMAMLLNDDSFVQSRLLNWLHGTMTALNTGAIDSTLYRLLNQQLVKTLSLDQMHLLSSQFNLAQDILVQQVPVHVVPDRSPSPHSSNPASSNL
jgi:hypothetical protein